MLSMLIRMLASHWSALNKHVEAGEARMNGKKKSLLYLFFNTVTYARCKNAKRGIQLVASLCRDEVRGPSRWRFNA